MQRFLEGRGSLGPELLAHFEKFIAGNFLTVHVGSTPDVEALDEVLRVPDLGTPDAPPDHLPLVVE